MLTYDDGKKYLGSEYTQRPFRDISLAQVKIRPTVALFRFRLLTTVILAPSGRGKLAQWHA